MNWQMILVIVVVTAAAWYLLRSTWRTWRPKQKGCGRGCHCAAEKGGANDTSLIPVEQVGLRQASGRRSGLQS